MIRFELWLNLPSYNNLLEAVAALMEVISHRHGYPQPANGDLEIFDVQAFAVDGFWAPFLIRLRVHFERMRPLL